MKLTSFGLDCCDGSDEWGSSTTCSNICDELGKSAREEKERLAIVARKGFTTRKELAKQGLQMKVRKQSLQYLLAFLDTDIG